MLGRTNRPFGAEPDRPSRGQSVPQQQLSTAGLRGTQIAKVVGHEDDEKGDLQMRQQVRFKILHRVSILHAQST